MYYTIYKTTNNINQKFYIGKHQTKNLNDDYFGSGKNLKRAIQKYGLENFSKEILFVFDNEQEMNAKEKELVTEEFCLQKDNYNICEGGKGGFSYINSLPQKKEWARKNRIAGNKKLAQQSHQKAYLKYITNPKFCPNCNILIKYKKRENKFCSHSCAATYTNLIRIYKSKKIKMTPEQLARQEIINTPCTNYISCMGDKEYLGKCCQCPRGIELYPSILAKYQKQQKNRDNVIDTTQMFDEPLDDNF